LRHCPEYVLYNINYILNYKHQVHDYFWLNKIILKKKKMLTVQNNNWNKDVFNIRLIVIYAIGYNL